VKINFSQKLYNLDGEVLKSMDVQKKDGVPMTLGFASSEALVSPADKGERKDAVRSFSLALKVREGGEHDLETGEITMIKDCIEKSYASSLITGQTHILLEGKPNPIKPRPSLVEMAEEIVKGE